MPVEVDHNHTIVIVTFCYPEQALDPGKTDCHFVNIHELNDYFAIVEGEQNWYAGGEGEKIFPLTVECKFN